MAVDLLTRLLSPSAVNDNGWVNKGPTDDYWYEPRGMQSGSGVTVTPEVAMRVSAVYSCVRVKASTVAQTPLFLYRNQPGGHREKATDQHLYGLLHDEANTWQTANEFWKTIQAQVELRGNGYARIVPGPSGPFDQLIPIHPDRVTPKRLPSGAIIYKVRDDLAGSVVTLNQDEMFHLRGPINDGFMGMSTLRAAQEAIGLAAAAEGYGARSFGQGVRLSGVLQHPGHLDEEPARRIAKSFSDAYGGVGNAFKVAVLEEDMKWQTISMTSEDAQFIQSRSFQIEEIARFFGVPMVMIQSQEKTTSWGSGVESIMLGFVTFTMMDVFVGIEQRVTKDLILDPRVYAAQHLVDALLRADSKTRAETLAIWRSWGIINADTWRELENMNALPNGLGQTYLQPANYVIAGQQAAIPIPGPVQTGAVDPRTAAFARVLAGQVVRKQMAAVEKAARRFADDGDGWEAWAHHFFDDEVSAEISERCFVPPAAAMRYARRQRDELLFHGAAVAQSWGESQVGELTDLMLEAA